MKLLQSLKKLTTAATVALTVMIASTSISFAAGGTGTSQTSSTVENTTVTEKTEVTPPAPSPTPLAPLSTPTPNTSNSSGSYNQNYNYQSSGTTSYNSSAPCGTQVQAKAGNNPNNQIDWSIGFTVNLNNPCQAQPATKNETLNCQQQRLNGMQMILTTFGNDPKKSKMISAQEMREYLDTICVITTS